MPNKIIGLYYKTEIGAETFIQNMRTDKQSFHAVQCHGGYLVVSGEIYKKYFTNK